MLAAGPEPEHLQAVKDEDVRRWGTLELLDLLKYADFLAALTDDFTSMVSREDVDRRPPLRHPAAVPVRAGHVDTGRRLVWVAQRLQLRALFDPARLHVEAGFVKSVATDSSAAAT